MYLNMVRGNFSPDRHRYRNNAMSLQTQVLAHFTSKQIHLSPRYIATLLNSLNPVPTGLNQGILERFQASFLNSTLQQSAGPQSFLSPDLPNQHNVSIPGPALVQIVHVQDIGISRLAQLEALEKALNEQGPQGRRVIDLPPEDEAEDNPTQNGSLSEGLSVGKGICKILLEDGRGERVYGMEVKPLEGIKVGMQLGCKVAIPTIKTNYSYC